MRKKIAHTLTVCLFLFIFGVVFGGEYWGFQSERETEMLYEASAEEHGKNFSVSNVTHLDDVSLHVTPDISFLEALVEQIDSAKQRVYVEVYIFTEKDLRDALLRAHKRGVEVKILLENNPYKAPYLNDNHYESFQKSGIDVRWSDPLNYSLNHSKFIIIDERVFVSTGNFSYSLFKYNRDFLLEIGDTLLVSKLTELFLNDFYHKNIGVIHPNLVLSPDYSRVKLESLILSAQKNIDMYFPYISDPGFEEILFQRAAHGVKIRLIVEEDFYENNQDVVKEYKNKGISIFPLKSEKLHAKAILVDESILYIGSINFSTFSFDENRELGLLVSDEKIIQSFIKQFLSDL